MAKPPRYSVDMSVAPRDRYDAVARRFKAEIAHLPSLFAEVIEEFVLGLGQALGMRNGLPISAAVVIRVAKLVFRRMYSKEEEEELRGISERTGVGVSVLIAFNVLVDTFFGCSSGGARVRSKKGKSRMLHFRTLDWGMEGLRRMVVLLEFRERVGGDVVAQSVTYAGYVGVLTGVRKGLSISLNARPTHNNSHSFVANVRFYLHLLLVVFGRRPPISSIIRSYLVPTPTSSDSPSTASPTTDPATGTSSAIANEQSPTTVHPRRTSSTATAASTTSSAAPLILRLSPDSTVKPNADLPPRAAQSLLTILTTLPAIPTTAAYLILSNGHATAVMEKDLRDAVTRSSTSFVVCANHDEGMAELGQEGDSDGAAEKKVKMPERSWLANSASVGMEEILKESVSRAETIRRRWKRAVGNKKGVGTEKEREEMAGEGDVVRLVSKSPINEVGITHFAAVMDPDVGRVVWCRVRTDSVEYE
ncbi:hypothetical protein BDY21DRAFT_349603 [Lineolata rhizophorae]|uniref:ceramidase n=1 Tax=Lineolata rhizophorae TaxID=578093 RepID=A0A6A6NUZ4_9PEZI|nr:hypothetical protein BDY21DRAFT_349603 [Lineolata rhizophorae]